MKTILVLSLLLSSCSSVRHAKWDGQRFTCPSGTSVYASEHEALQGRQDFAYCVKDKF
jgi:hypothetical protein